MQSINCSCDSIEFSPQISGSKLTFSRLAAIVLRIANESNCACLKLSNEMKGPLIGIELALPPCNGFHGRITKMAATTLNQRIAGFQIEEQTEAVAAADRIAQNTLLSELPGAAFAVLTLAYIVLSFAHLA